MQAHGLTEGMCSNCRDHKTLFGIFKVSAKASILVLQAHKHRRKYRHKHSIPAAERKSIYKMQQAISARLEDCILALQFGKLEGSCTPYTIHVWNQDITGVCRNKCHLE